MSDSAPTPGSAFWKKPEGKTGMLGIAALAVAGIFLWGTIAPWVVAMLANTLTALVLAVVIGVIIYVVWNYRKLFAWMFRIVMRWVTELIVTINPIGVMKEYIAQLRKNEMKMQEEIGKVKGVRLKLERTIVDQEKKVENAHRLAKQAQKTGNKMQLALQARKVGRQKTSSVTFVELLGKLKLMEKVLQKYLEVTKFLIADTVDEVQMREIEFNAVRAAYRAMKTAQNIIQGQGDEKEKFAMTMEFTLNDITQKMGEMEEFMDVTKGFIEGIDLQNGVFEQDGLDMLDDWENKAESIMLGDSKNQLIKSNPTPDTAGEVIEIKVAMSGVVTGNKYLDN